MIQFNELRITPDSKELIIEAQVKQDPYFEDVKITRIEVKRILDSNGTKNLIFEDDTFEASNLIRLSISAHSLLDNNGFKNALVEVIIYTNEEHTSPEGYANPTVSALVCDLYPFYIKTLLNIKVIDSLCSNSDELIDCILKFKALELAFKTGNAPLAYQYWFKYFVPTSDIFNRNFVNKNCYD